MTEQKVQCVPGLTVQGRKAESPAELKDAPLGSYYVPQSKTALMFKSPYTGIVRFIRTRGVDTPDNGLPAISTEKGLTVSKCIQLPKCAVMVIDDFFIFMPKMP